MVSGVGAVALQGNASELRIDANEVLRQSRTAQQPAVLAGQRRRSVQEIRESTDVAVGKEGVRRSVTSQSLRPCQCGAVNHAGAGNVQSREDSVKPRSVASGARDVECFKDSVLIDVRVV